MNWIDFNWIFTYEILSTTLSSSSPLCWLMDDMRFSPTTTLSDLRLRGSSEIRKRSSRGESLGEKTHFTDSEFIANFHLVQQFSKCKSFRWPLFTSCCRGRYFSDSFFSYQSPPPSPAHSLNRRTIVMSRRWGQYFRYKPTIKTTICSRFPRPTTETVETRSNWFLILLSEAAGSPEAEWEDVYRSVHGLTT